MSQPQPLKEPISLAEMEKAIENGEYISGIVAIDLGDIIDNDIEWFNDEVTNQLVGDIRWAVLLMDLSWQIAGYQGSTILFLASGDPSEIVHNTVADQDNDDEDEK